MAGGHNKINCCTEVHLRRVVSGPKVCPVQQAKLRVGHVHFTLNEVVPLRNTNRSYA